ncbi:hypothetical protein [Bacillus sp. JCM 19041]|uniref:hypothetical protein n=1 Tax=Bacillus sp. JCM 19041 TaxID=1460637 RepID=UPI0006CFAE05
MPNLGHLELTTNSYLRFMYYFISGQSEFYHGRYKSAIRSFKIAERLIEEVNDPAERAEFYQKLGISYYRIDQYTFAASYMEMALEFFEKNEAYIELEINSKLILAAIDTELERFDEAERIYNDLLESSKPFPAAHALVYRNMGLNRMTQDKLGEAEIYLEAALSIKEHRESILGVKTKFNLVNIQLKIDNYTSGLDEIEKEVNYYQLTEYIAKCKINRGLYLNHDVSLVEKGINELLQYELYFDCSEVAKEISSFYEREGKLSLALEYLNLAYRMQKKQSQLGVDQK